MADMGRILDKTILAKLPSSEVVEVDESFPEHKQWAKYWQQNAKGGAVIISAQESEDVILALREANELRLIWPSDTVLNMWTELINIFQPDD